MNTEYVIAAIEGMVDAKVNGTSVGVRQAQKELRKAFGEADLAPCEKVRRGWRQFHCSECEHRWKWPSRDALSPSGENCPRCDEWCFPYHSEIDATIPCDDMGNLTVPWNWNGQAPNDPSSARLEAMKAKERAAGRIWCSLCKTYGSHYSGECPVPLGMPMLKFPNCLPTGAPSSSGNATALAKPQ